MKNQHRWAMRLFVYMLGLGLVLSYLSYASREAFGDQRDINPGIGPNTSQLLLYQASDYRYLIIPLPATPPPGFERPGFDDTAFNTGSAASPPTSGVAASRVVSVHRPSL